MALSPKISIIIAVFNAEDTLNKCLGSIREQTYKNREVIIIDGASTDGTIGILQANLDIVSFWSSEADNGIYDAWNKGLEKATGDWICFIGADDYFAQNDSLTQMVKLASPAVNFISSKIAYIDEHDSMKGVTGSPWNWKVHKVRQRIAHPGALHARELFQIYGRFDTRYRIAGDYDFLLRCGTGIRSAFCDQVIVHMGNSGCSQTQLQKVHKELRIIQSSHPEIGKCRASLFYLIRKLKRIATELARRHENRAA